MPTRAPCWACRSTSASARSRDELGAARLVGHPGRAVPSPGVQVPGADKWASVRGNANNTHSGRPGHVLLGAARPRMRADGKRCCARGLVAGRSTSSATVHHQ